MAASNSILKLQVDDKQYEASLKSAQSGMQALMDALRQSGKAFNDVDKQTEQYVRELGKMEAKATTTRGRIGEMSSAFIELSQVEKQLTNQERQSPVGKALTESLEQLKRRTIDAKNELENLNDELNGTSSGGKGGFLSGLGDKTSGMLQVFGGNLLAEGVSRLTSELAGSVQESIELARQGEGIRMAFERLNKPGLLDELKAATHGTVSEIELMQQAIKFENFKLPVEDLANYLAFAQQKAKDTGESIDYLVNSIVTGLGRQSKQILDNLGISAAELTKRMNEGATMTQAVSDIIREEMAKAGDYVETAADRAARATADTKNKMEELGRSAMPVAEEFASAWAEIRNGAMSLVLPVLSTVADSIRDIREILGGEWDMPKLKPGIQNLADGPAKSNQPKKPTWGDVPVVTAPGGYVEVTDKSGNVLHGGHYDSDAQLQAMMKRWNTTTTRRTGGSRTPKQSIEEMLLSSFSKTNSSIDPESLKWKYEPSVNMWDILRKDHYANLKPEQLTSRSDFEEGQNRAKNNIENRKRERDSPIESGKKLLNGISQLTDGLEKIGIDIPDEIQSVIGVIQGVMQVIEAVNTIIGVTQTSALTANTVAMTSLTAALWANTSTSWLPWANGGVVHAAGGIVTGNTYSGDQIPAMLNAGEVVLNRAQAGNLASQLENGASQNMQLETTITGEQIRLVLNNNSRRRGKGEYVTSKIRKS